MDALDRLAQMRPRLYEQRMALAKALETHTAAPPVFATGFTKANTVNEETSSLIAFVSTPRLDRMGDIVRPEGMDNADFRRNPVVLWAHDDTLPPIGRSAREEIQAEGILAEPVFDLKNDPKGFHKQIFGQYVDGVLNAFSIRFLPRSWEKIMVKNPENGAEIWSGGFDFKEWQLLEFSAVPIPAQPDALALAANGISHLARALGVEGVERTLDGDLSERLAQAFSAALANPVKPGVPPWATPHVKAADSCDPAVLAAIEGAIEQLKEFMGAFRK